MSNKFEKLTELLTLWEQKKVEVKKIKEKYKNFTGKLVVISDLHIPFIDLSVFKKFLETGLKNTKLVVIAGDFVNFDKFSRFIHIDGIVSAKKEIDLANKYLEILCSYKIPIIYLKANHELRLEKFLYRTLPNDIATDLVDLGLSLTNFFKYKNLILVNNWFCQIGDVIVAHPEVNSTVRGRAVDWTIEFFEERIRDFKCVIIGHTHKQFKMFRKGKLGIECGAMCKILDYTMDSKISSYRTEIQYLGYAYSILKKGKCELKETDFVTLSINNKIL
jgi:predicted phosphodiesterase